MLKTVTTFFHFLINALCIVCVLFYQEIVELAITYIYYIEMDMGYQCKMDLCYEFNKLQFVHYISSSDISINNQKLDL